MSRAVSEYKTNEWLNDTWCHNKQARVCVTGRPHTASTFFANRYRKFHFVCAAAFIIYYWVYNVQALLLCSIECSHACCFCCCFIHRGLLKQNTFSKSLIFAVFKKQMICVFDLISTSSNTVDSIVNGTVAGGGGSRGSSRAQGHAKGADKHTRFHMCAGASDVTFWPGEVPGPSNTRQIRGKKYRDFVDFRYKKVGRRAFMGRTETARRVGNDFRMVKNSVKSLTLIHQWENSV